MADNTILNPGSGGDTIRTLDRGTAKSEVIAIDFGDPGAGNESLASISNPLPIQPAATYYVSSTGNSTNSQLSAGATFTGTIESTVSQQSLSLLITNDQPIILTVNQYITSNPTSLASSWAYNIAAGQNFAQSLTLNANYFNLSVKNVGSSATTNLHVDSYYGTIFPAGQVPTQGATPIVYGILQKNFTFTSSGNSEIVVNAGYSTLGIQVTSVGVGGTLSFYGSNDGITYHEIYGYVYDPDLGYNRLVPSISSTIGIRMDISGINYIKIQATALTSGSIIGSAYGSPDGSVVSVAGIARTPQFPTVPTAASVGVTSASIVSANPSRTGLILTNTSNNIVSLALGPSATSAVLYSGITLSPFGCFTMDSNSFTTGAIYAIASSAGSNLAIQEFS